MNEVYKANPNLSLYFYDVIKWLHPKHEKVWLEKRELGDIMHVDRKYDGKSLLEEQAEPPLLMQHMVSSKAHKMSIY